MFSPSSLAALQVLTIVRTTRALSAQRLRNLNTPILQRITFLNPSDSFDRAYSRLSNSCARLPASCAFMYATFVLDVERLPKRCSACLLSQDSCFDFVFAIHLGQSCPSPRLPLSNDSFIYTRFRLCTTAPTRHRRS